MKFTLLNRKEITIMDQLIEELSCLENQTLIRCLKQHRKDIVKEHNAQVKALKRIEEDDPEVYQIIWWHYVKGKTWMETFIKVYPDLISYSGDYAKKRYRRYMAKIEDGDQ